MLDKGPDRPLNSELDRAYVLAGLASVNMVTFFSTRSPLELIQKIRPEVYVKGGDYDMETLEETRVVRSWGGKSLAIPFVDGFSTTALVQRIRSPLRKAAFLDLDGVINKDKVYESRWEDFEFVPGAIEGMQLLQMSGYTLVVVTNQSGLARGYYTEDQYQALTRQMLGDLSQKGVDVAGVCHYHHHPEGYTTELSVSYICRNLGSGLIEQAARELNLSIRDSLLVGDKLSDIRAARAAGVDKAYILASDNTDTTIAEAQADGHFNDLLSCAKYLAQTQHKGILK